MLCKLFIYIYYVFICVVLSSSLATQPVTPKIDCRLVSRLYKICILCIVPKCTYKTVSSVWSEFQNKVILIIIVIRGVITIVIYCKDRTDHFRTPCVKYSEKCLSGTSLGTLFLIMCTVSISTPDDTMSRDFLSCNNLVFYL